MMHVADKLVLDLDRPIDMRENELVALELRHARGIPIECARIVSHGYKCFAHADGAAANADFQKLRGGGSCALAAQLGEELGMGSGFGKKDEGREYEPSSRTKKRIIFCGRHK
jgi:hypothetical protein